MVATFRLCQTCAGIARCIRAIAVLRKLIMARPKVLGHRTSKCFDACRHQPPYLWVMTFLFALRWKMRFMENVASMSAHSVRIEERKRWGVHDHLGIGMPGKVKRLVRAIAFVLGLLKFWHSRRG